MQQNLTSQRRRSLLLAAGASLAAPLAANAQTGGDDIVIGGSIPMTGVFAFAGVGINLAIGDYVKMVNDAGGIKGRKLRPEYQSTAYMQGFLAAMLFVESAKRCLDAGKPLNGTNLKAALNSLKDFDTGGLIGVPITIRGNSIPVGRVYQADMKAQKMVPASDWIAL